ncbi:MAG TPA: prolipoprotein diacylglyceryl transferase [Planctomycetota bacterium]|nr:prolipoprotein diacylglyceryl transferase [Planctomycetota bacterium]
MSPTLFTIPILGLAVPAYGTMLMVGFLLAVWMARRRSAALGLEKVEVFDMGIFAIVGGVLGARLLHVVIYWPDYFVSRAMWPEWMGPFGWLGAMLATWKGGLVFYGGLGGGILALWLYTRRRKIPFVDVLDFVAAPAAVGLAMTRIGCFLNGCCFGRVAGDLPWGVTYPQHSHVYALFENGQLCGFREAVPVHPTQLYETLAALAMAVLIWWLIWPRRTFAGGPACAFGLLYALWRFCNEFLRADTFADGPSLVPLNLSVFQHISVGLMLVFGAAWLAARRAGRKPFEPPAPKPEDGRPGSPAA